MTFKENLLNLSKRWLLNSEGAISFTKIGAELASVAGVIVGLPQAMFAVGITHIVIPIIVVELAKLVLVVGSLTAVVGARDALDKIKK